MTNKPELTKRNTPIDFYLCSGSKIKIDALTNARNDLDLHATIYPFKQAESGVNEQPVGEIEILRGALNRVTSAYEADPRGEVYFTAENGLQSIEDKWMDYAIVLAFTPAYGSISYVKSEAVEFPSIQVSKTFLKEGGFKLNTVGKTLKEDGLVKFHDDPHLDLVGKSRREILKDAFKELVNYLPQGLFLKDLNYSS